MAKQSNMQVSVIICAYTEKRWHDLVAAIASVQQQTLPSQEIILVVDHNPTLYDRALATFVDVKVIENTDIRGLSGARNSGLLEAHGNIIAFMDEDAVARPDWLAQLASVYQSSHVLGAGGAIRPFWQARRPAWFPEEFQWVVGCTYRGMPGHLAPVRNLIGCNMSFRREVFDAVGGFRNGIGRVGALPVGCEETELCIRARQAFPSHHFYYQPTAEVLHRVPNERTRGRYFLSRCYSEGISKALVTQWVGSQDGLASEWTYTLRTLPFGCVRGVWDALQGDRAGVARAFAIVVGLFTTTFGYLRGRMAQKTTSPHHPQIRHASQIHS